MGTDATAYIGYGIDFKDEEHAWLDEDELPAELDIIYYGTDLCIGKMLVLKNTVQWVWDTQPKELKLDLFSRSQIVAFTKLLKQIPDVNPNDFQPKWMLLASYG